MYKLLIRCIFIFALLFTDSSLTQAAINVGPYYGTWNAKTTYPVGSLITENDQTYIAVIENKNKSVSANTDKWKLLGSVITGLNGVQGIQGLKGDKGDPGIQGIQGIQGVTGPQGIQGPIGPKGNDGPTNFIYKIGDIGPAGGYIFFVDRFDEYPNFDYLEAAPTESSNNVAWATGTINCFDEIDTLISCTDGSIYTATDRIANRFKSRAIGMGKANTETIILRHSGDDHTSFAAGVAYDYISPPPYNHSGDWFLGSEGEMMLMNNNLVMAGVPTSDRLWTSSETQAGYVKVQRYIQDYMNYDYSKSQPQFKVRAIRSF